VCVCVYIVCVSVYVCVFMCVCVCVCVYIHTYTYIYAVCMGGRAAEEVIFGPDHVTSGASSDFEQATQVCVRVSE
jgi:hypothetical protein